MSAAGVAIVGCGLIGRKRAAALAGARLVACADTVAIERAEALARTRPRRRAPSRRGDSAVSRPDVDIVIVATTNDALAPVGHRRARGRQARARREAGGAQRSPSSTLIAAARRANRRWCASASITAIIRRC